MTGKVQHPTVLAVHLRDDGQMDGCNHYRFRIPFEMIRKKMPGSTMDWAPQVKVREWAVSNAAAKPSDYDIFLMPRHRPLPYGHPGTPSLDDIPDSVAAKAKSIGAEMEGRSHLLDSVRVLKSGQSVVLEYDDDYWTGSRDLSYDYQPLLKELLNTVDAVTVSTPHLRKLVQKYSLGTPTYVLPNCVNFAEWQGWERWKRWPDDYIVIGLTGSATHEEDWKVMQKPLEKLMDKHGNVALIIGGYEPDYLANLKVYYPDRVYVSPPLQYESYPGLVRQCDITLCPVVPDDEFNQSKSAIKAIEGMASGRTLLDGRQGGSVPVTSDLSYYRTATGRNRRGITVRKHTAGAWYRALERLVTDRELRTNYSQKAYAWAYRNRRIETKWRLWWTAYSEIHRRKRK